MPRPCALFPSVPLRGPLVLALACLVASPLTAQSVGRIVGRVLDAEQGRPVTGAVVEVEGEDLRSTTALDGRYTLAQVPSGTVTLRVRMIGYQAKVVTGIAVPADGVVQLDVALSAEAVQLEELEVTALAERGSVNRVLEEQRNSTVIMNAVSAEQIERSPDSDAGQAVQRVSGVTVQEGRYVIVRGLGERYTTTSLNGSRIPSPEPERRVVPLDLFPSSLLDGIATSKTFTADRPGDFSGAAVDLRTREFPAGRKMSFSTSVGANFSAVGEPLTRGASTDFEWLGFAGSERDIPGAARAAGDLGGISDQELNQIIGSFRNSWTPGTTDGGLNSSLALSVGGEDQVGSQLIGYVGSLTWSRAYEVRADERRALALATGSGVQPFNEHTGSTGRVSVLWGGMLNLTTRLGLGTKLWLNNSYTRSGDNEAQELVGSNEEFNTDFVVSRLGFTERAVRSSQLGAQHLLAGRHLLDWSATATGVSRNEPDRSDLVHVAETDPATGQVVRGEWFGATRSATKTFSELEETSWDLAGNLRFALGSAAGRNAVKVGGGWRATDRTADSRAFDIFNRGLSQEERDQPAERIFDGRYAAAGLLTLFSNPHGGIYSAEDRVLAGYAQSEIWFGNVQLIAGARLEHARLRVRSQSPSGEPVVARLDDTDVLPALALNVPLTETHNLRFAASQTLARPEYRELSPVSYFEPLGGTITRGNPDLDRTLIRNVDARWEWFPSSGEVLSAGVFAKHFSAPIEKTYVGTTGAANLSFINAEGGYNYGVELEARKSLRGLLSVLAPVTLFANTTLMQSEITPGNDSISALTSAERPMVGQSEYVVNAGLNLDWSSGVAATLLYNLVGPRIVEAGISPLPDAYEQERHLLDASLQLPLGRALSLRLDGRNLLDARVEILQGSVTRWSYRQGRTVSFGVRYGN